MWFLSRLSTRAALEAERGLVPKARTRIAGSVPVGLAGQAQREGGAGAVPDAAASPAGGANTTNGPTR